MAAARYKATRYCSRQALDAITGAADACGGRCLSGLTHLATLHERRYAQRR
jgi:hypothetical protein